MHHWQASGCSRASCSFAHCRSSGTPRPHCTRLGACRLEVGAPSSPLYFAAVFRITAERFGARVLVRLRCAPHSYHHHPRRFFFSYSKSQLLARSFLTSPSLLLSFCAGLDRFRNAIPHNFPQLPVFVKTALLRKSPQPPTMSEIQASKEAPIVEAPEDREQKHTIEDALERKSFFQAALPVFACGAGLFSDGYINNVCLPFFFSVNGLICAERAVANFCFFRSSVPSTPLSAGNTVICTTSRGPRVSSPVSLSPAPSSDSSSLASPRTTGRDRIPSSPRLLSSSSSLRSLPAPTGMARPLACSTCWLPGVSSSVSALEVRNPTCARCFVKLPR